MWLYLIIFSIPVFAFINGGSVNKNKTFLIAYTTFLAFFVGMSDMFGGFDRYIYGEVFDSIANKITLGLPVTESHVYTFFEKGYMWLNIVIALFTANRYIFILIVTLIIFFNLYMVFERHFENYPFAYMLFLGMTFFFTFTYLRQMLAVSFGWLAIKYLLDDKKVLFFILVFVVASLHKSGFVFMLLFFIPIKKWNPLFVIGVLAICAVLGLSGVTGQLYDVVMQSDMIVKQGNDYNTSGTARIAYFFEVVFFVWIILQNYSKIKETRQNLIFLNMAWAFCVVLLLFLRSSDGGRVAWYFNMGIIYIISLVATQSNAANGISKVVKSSIAPLLIAVMLVLYFRVFFAWQVVMNLYPYKTFLTPGHRPGDPVYAMYEYDKRYDLDKFYRPAFRFVKKDGQK